MARKGGKENYLFQLLEIWTYYCRMSRN